MGLQKSPRRPTMSDGGLEAGRMGGKSMSAPPSALDSDVSGNMMTGKAPKTGAGPDSPSVMTPANQAAKAGRISTSGQARGGPQQMSDAVGTPGSGTKAGKGTGKSGGSL